MTTPRDAASLATVALKGRCPRCGIGPLFSGYLTVAPACTHCDMGFAGNDTGDGPAFFIMMPLCLIVAGLALALELKIGPPLWVHVVLWPVFILAVSGLSLRPIKALMVGLQYRYRDVERENKGVE
jgi:cytochrome c oxidase subunit 3